jgi:hypothetical protein
MTDKTAETSSEPVTEISKEEFDKLAQELQEVQSQAKE